MSFISLKETVRPSQAQLSLMSDMGSHSQAASHWQAGWPVVSALEVALAVATAAIVSLILTAALAGALLG
jgi:hypothetical protein